MDRAARKDLENRRRYVDQQTRAAAQREQRKVSEETSMKRDLEEKAFESLEQKRTGGGRKYF